MNKRRRIDRFSDEDILTELHRVAKIFEYRPFTRHDYDKHAEKCKGSTVISRFHSWKNALSLIGITEVVTRKTWSLISNEDLFLEMSRIYEIVNQRPSKAEWEGCKPRYSYSTYKRRFGGWVKAFDKFQQWQVINEGVVDRESGLITGKPESLKTRHIPLKNRLEVMKRDNFSCVFCGASPALDANVVLHIDHIVAFSRGGDNSIENLQILCDGCNWKKGST